jgi:metal-responsive CopG/Arc/MetJ family transcriptional regulator
MRRRIILSLDEALIQRAEQLLPPGRLSELINALLSEWLIKQEQAEVQAQMREGYLAVREERQELNEEWQAIDGVGWPAW